MAWQRGQDHDELLEGITMSEPIKAAMPKEEWERWIKENADDEIDLDIEEGQAGLQDGELVVGYDGGMHVVQQVSDRHACAALALFDQSFGFTHEDVKSLREVAETIKDHAPNYSWVVSIADRIAALLPEKK